MNQEHWRRLKEIIADALEEDNPSARPALLARECAEDAILLREAESFLVQADTIRMDEVDGLEECRGDGKFVGDLDERVAGFNIHEPCAGV